MNTTTSITQRSSILADVDQKFCTDLGDEHIHFNVHKIYLGSDSFTFESVTHIKCGRGFELKIEQTLKEAFHLNNNNLNNEAFKEIIEKLYADSINSLQEHVEISKRNARRNLPIITITFNVLSNYLSSVNYKDLHHSCFPGERVEH